jgi:cell division protein FtsI/penicillin-binding protein 2
MSSHVTKQWKDLGDKLEKTIAIMGRNRSILLSVFTCAALATCIPAVAGPAHIAKHNTRHLNPAHTRNGMQKLSNSTEGDVTTFEDPVVRQAAIQALGRYDGSVVAIDPNSGRILSIVNQKMAFSGGFKPCSTIKPVIAVAALQEGFVTRDTKIRVTRRKYLNLTEAIAHSNNAYFEELGRRMGFDTVSNYARELGLGERAGYEISQEQPGTVPDEPPARGGVGRMSSFGEGILMTPLQLGALVSAVANGGTLYYLQYPQTPEEQDNFEPRVKRMLDIQPLLPDLREGMHAAVTRGTARRSNMPDDEDVSGKTGSCSDSGSRLGWFVSYMDQPNLKIVLVILMRGHSHAVRGPMAAGIAGRIYRELQKDEYITKQDANAGIPTVAEKLTQ